MYTDFLTEGNEENEGGNRTGFAGCGVEMKDDQVENLENPVGIPRKGTEDARI
jgi:hypothetical protein